jgi:hypothetical protein
MDDNELTNQMNQAAWAGAWAEFFDAFNRLAALKPEQWVNDEAFSILFAAVLAIEALQQQPDEDEGDES